MTYQEGEKCPITGTYQDITCSSYYTINIEKGETFPPSNCGDRNATWKLVSYSN